MILSFHPTIRALITLIFLGYLSTTVALSEDDVIASFVVVGIGLSIVVFGVWVFIQGYKTKKRLSLAFYPATPTFHQLHGHVISGSPANIHFNLGLPGIAPLTNLYLEFFLHEASDFFISTLFTSGADLQQPQQLEVQFPHRGIWQVAESHWELKDIFGFWIFKGKHIPREVQASFVYPPPSTQQDFPPMYSSIREGDLSYTDHQPSGDHYELKRYNPSDGLRKIVWKVFARTGELLSRHPEQTMTPEGRIFLFVAGGMRSDRTYAAAHRYYSLMHEQGLEVSATGANFNGKIVQNSPDGFLETSLTTAFNPIDLEAISHLLNTAGVGTVITHVGVLFNLHSSPEETIRCVERSIALLKQQGITPVLLSVRDSENPVAHAKPSFLHKFIFEKEKNADKITARDLQLIRAFKNKIAAEVTAL